MQNTIYIQLLNEGTYVFRPVFATKISQDTYKVEGNEVFDPDDETWEFAPGTIVVVEEKDLNGEIVLVAVREQNEFKLSLFG